MKHHHRIGVLSTLAISIGLGVAQANPLEEEHLSCGADQAHHVLYQQDPQLLERVQTYEFKNQLSPFPEVNTKQFNSQYTIPVVFHVVHANGAENITDAQIQEAVKQINEDYNGADTRKDEVFPEFANIYADVGIKFVLARKDPDGNPTDGITRHFSPSEVTQFNNGSDEQMKAKYMWPRDKYLNMYVVRSAGGQSGSAWAFYPIQVDDSHIARDGVISSHWAVGRSGTATPTHYKILTHEIGHWAYLAHTFNNACSTSLAQFIWGDGNYAGYGDYVNDTPATLAGSGCNKRWSPCGDSVGIANSQNYMDYGYCSMMFTEGQKTRMLNALNSPMADRNKLWQASNLSATGVTGQPVSALFNIEKNVIMPGGSISFNDVSEAEVGSVSSWQWSFPGGSPSSYSGQTPPAISYANPGNYDVTLTVTNSNGDSNTVTKSDYILVDSDITMRTASETTCNARFYDSGGNLPEADEYGNREDHTLTINPAQAGQVVEVSFDTFRLQTSSNCDLDSLTIHNGPTADAPIIGKHCGLDNPGTVRAQNGSGALTFVFHSDVKAREIGWQANIGCSAEQTTGQPIANANGSYLTKGATAVNFSSKGSIDTNLGGSIISYLWDFGDGNSSTAANPSYSYPQDGDYVASLTVTDNDGNTAVSEANVKVYPENANPTAVPRGPYSAAVDESIYFDASSSFDIDGTVTSYLWDFGDGATSTELKQWHRFTSAGTYTVSLTVTDNTGLTHTATTTATIGGSDNSTPTANANGPYTANAGDTITFSSSGSSDADGTIVGFNWDFGDGNSSNLASPDHAYATAGSYTATLTVTDDSGATGTSTANVTINNDNGGGGGGGTGAPLPNECGISTPITSGRLEDGQAKCLGAGSTIWLSMGDVDAQSSVAITTGHGTGNLDVYYSNGGWPSEATAQASSTGPDNNECIIVTNQSQYWSYLKINNSGGDATIVLDYNTNACRSIDNGGGSNQAPTANANGPYTADAGQSLTFSAAGSTDSDGTIVSYAWDFGDGNSAATATAAHSYATAGNYTATLTVTDDLGATAQATANVTINSTGGGGTPTMCGPATIDYGNLTDGRVECVSGGRLSFYFLVNDPDTVLYAATNGGTGNVDIYYNASTWATVQNATAASFNQGNNEVLQVTAPSGYVYFTLDTSTSFEQVSFMLSTTPPVFNQNGQAGADHSLSGEMGIAAPDDPDCALPDTDTSNPALNLYTFDNVVDEYAETNFWLRMRGTAVDSSYKIKFCQGNYGSIELNNRTETLSNGTLGHSFNYEYKHFDARSSNTDTGKAIVEVNGEKAILTLSFPLQVAEVAHPVQPSCDDLRLDADFDGIPDCAEAPGKTFYTMPLYDWGARTGQTDLFIEVDYMAKHALRDYDGNYVYNDDGSVIIDHGTEPKRATLDRVKQVFAERGIAVHMDVGDLFDQSPGLDPADYDLGGGQAVPYKEYLHLSAWTDSYNGRTIEIPGMTDFFMPNYFENNPERDHIFYYVLFGNSQGGANRGSSGQAPDLLDRYMYLSLGGTGWKLTDDSPENTNRLVNAQASTMVHELGHIFGLSHDGFPDASAQNYKLNYPSAMNYLFQLQGGPTDKFADIDYSTMVRERYYINRSPRLDWKCTPIIQREHPENYTWGNLVHGLSSSPQDFHIGFSDGQQPKIIETQTSEALLEGGLDLNCDSNLDFTVGSYDVNNDGQIDQLWDHNDWEFLTFFFHYYNYDVKDQFATSNEFLLTPNYHIKWGNSPTDAKYPGVSHPTPPALGDDPQALLTPANKRLLNSKAASASKIRLPKQVGVKEEVLPAAFFEQLHRQQQASRKAHKQKLAEKAKNK